MYLLQTQCVTSVIDLLCVSLICSLASEVDVTVVLQGSDSSLSYLRLPPVSVTHEYKKRYINKLQNGIILLMFII